jgi:ribosome-binding protein aMBF1 (putative translation factor)
VPTDPPPNRSPDQRSPASAVRISSPARARPKNPDARRALGDVIRALRVRRAWSQERLANVCGYDRAYVGQLERGTRWPTVEAIWYILHALGADWTEFGEAMQSEDAFRAGPAPRESRGP